jgi:hypothetical protein
MNRFLQEIRRIGEGSDFKEGTMRSYERVSATVFGVVSVAQLTRAVLALPAQVGGYVIPVWASFIAFAVTGVLAIWGFRDSGRSSRG